MHIIIMEHLYVTYAAATSSAFSHVIRAVSSCIALQSVFLSASLRALSNGHLLILRKFLQNMKFNSHSIYSVYYYIFLMLERIKRNASACEAILVRIYSYNFISFRIFAVYCSRIHIYPILECT